MVRLGRRLTLRCAEDLIESAYDECGAYEWLLAARSRLGLGSLIGVVQRGTPALTEAARVFDLPAEREAAEQAVDALFASMERCF